MTRWQYITAAVVLAAQADATTATPVFGQVLAVDPVFAPVGTRVMHRQCWKESTFADAQPGGAAPAVRRRCTGVQTTRSSREQIGYRVKYRYRGRLCSVQTDRPPGQRIRVHYDLQPIHF